jgi:hypothetical protein
MTPEQLKLIQQLAALGDVTYVKRGVSSLINAISEMNSKALELILEDNVSYHDTTKSIFLEKLDQVFKEFKKEDDKLIAYKGKCNSNECSNKNKNGISFVGNISGRYINFIIEQNEDSTVKDIYTCSDFCTNENVINENKRELSFTVYKDEKVYFKPSFYYISSNKKSISAINYLTQFNDTEISKDQIISWVKQYEEFYNSLDWFDLSYINISPFHCCFYHIKGIYDCILLEEEAAFALEEFKSVNLKEEIQLLKWLVKFEYLYYKLILLHPNIVSEESLKSGKIILYKDFNVYFKTEILQYCIDLQELIDNYYYEKLNKYNTLSNEDQEKEIPFDDAYEKTSSLKYHLEIRGII